MSRKTRIDPIAKSYPLPSGARWRAARQWSYLRWLRSLFQIALVFDLAACASQPAAPAPTAEVAASARVAPTATTALAATPTAPIPATATVPPTVGASGPLVRIKNAALGTYLYEADQQVKNGHPAATDSAGQWVMETYDGSKRFRNQATGHYIAIEHLLPAVEAIPVEAVWESPRWTFDSDPAAGPTLIRSVWHNGEVLLADPASESLQHGQPGPDLGAAQWSLEPANGQALASPTPLPIVALPTAALPAGSRGAAVPWIEYEAEAGETNGQVLGPDRAFGSFAAEASGRRAVELKAVGDYSQFTTQAAANALVVRFSIPDAPAGGGITATLSLYVDGVFRQKLSLTSRFAWSYGGDAYAFNAPGGGAHHFYDEVRALVGDIPAGATVRLQKDADDSAEYYVIDLVDLEPVGPPLTMPAGYLSLVKDCGAIPDDGLDDGPALQKCIGLARAQGTGVWLPAGTFESTSQPIEMAGVALRGAGLWYTTVHGLYARFNCMGDGCQFYDFAIRGETVDRNDQSPENGFNNGAGRGSRLENIWVEHTKVGYWVGPGATDGLVITGSRFRDLMADGVNFAGGTINSIVENSHFRNTGDDALASWSQSQVVPANTNNVFRFNTIQVPWRANCLAIYGGQDNRVEDNLCADVVTYPGILVAQSFDSTPFGGVTSIQRNSLIRAGGAMYLRENGALKIWAEQGSIAGRVLVKDVLIEAPTFAGLELDGSNALSALSFENVTINEAGTYGIAIGSAVAGQATFTNVTVTAPAKHGLLNDAPSWHFKLIQAAGNSGW